MHVQPHWDAMWTSQSKGETLGPTGGGSSIGGGGGGGGGGGSGIGGAIGGSGGPSDMIGGSGHGGHEGGGRLTNSSSPPRFLINLYHMVDNKETDLIISWGSTRTSFIIWDEMRFITEVFPRYSKTGRFNSFLAQLHNYGFKKIDWRYSEYKHEFFQEGKTHLLKNIKRRNQLSIVVPSQESTKLPLFCVTELQAMFGNIKRAQEEMKIRIRGAKQHVEGTFSEFQKIIMDTADELISTFADHESSIGEKRRFGYASIDYGVFEEFHSISEKFELLEEVTNENNVNGEPRKNRADNFMTLRRLIENPSPGYDEMSSSKRFSVFAHNESNIRNASGDGGSGGGRRITPFLYKLYDMVENKDTDSIISWKLPHRTSFVIWDHSKLSTDILPVYFIHSNYSSFISQLNIYGFKKISWEHQEYANQWFLGGRSDLLGKIKRRNASYKELAVSGATYSSAQVLKKELEKMQRKQENEKVQFSVYIEQTEKSLSAFKEMIISVTNVIKKMILQSKDDNGKTEITKKTKLNPFHITENSGIEEQNVLGENNKVQPLFQHLGWLTKLMEMEDDMRMLKSAAQTEMETYLSLCLGKTIE